MFEVVIVCCVCQKFGTLVFQCMSHCHVTFVTLNKNVDLIHGLIN